jgi:hypothetical protein
MFRTALVRVFTIPLIFIGLACSQGTQNADVGDESLAVIPQNAGILITIHSLEHLHQAFGIEELRAEYPEKFAEATSQMEEDIGIDLLDLNALRDNGFRPEDPVHVVFGTEGVPYLAVFLPGDAQAMTWLRSALDRGGTELEAAEAYEGVAIFHNRQEEMAIFERDGHITILGELNEDTPDFDAVASATQLIGDASAGSIGDEEVYQQVMSKFDPDADVTFYMSHRAYMKMMNLDQFEENTRGTDAEKIGPIMEAAMEVLDADKWYGGGAGYLGDDHATLKAYSWIGKDNPMLEVYNVDNDPVRFLEGLSSEPLLTYLFRLDLAKVWSLVERILEADPEVDEEFRDGLAEANRDLGVDIEGDIIEQVDGNFGLLVNHFGLGGSDAVLFLQVSDPGRFRGALEKLMAAASQAGPGGPSFIEDQIGDVKFHRLPVPMVGEVCFGLVSDHFVAAVSRARFESIVQGGGGFIESIANADVRAALREKRSSIFYINVGRLREDLSELAPMLGPDAAGATDILSEFSEVSAVMRPDDDGAWQECRIQGTSPGVWKRLARAVLESQ